MIALKDVRHDLSAHLAAGLSAADAKWGAQVNPPAVVVQSSAQYVTSLDYCTDHIVFDVVIVGPAGDSPATADALDDMIDQIRATCRTASPAGNKFMFQGVSGLAPFQDGELPQVVATISFERQND